MDAEFDEIESRSEDLAARKRAIVGRLIEAGGLSYSKIAELLELSPHAVAELAEKVRAKEAAGRVDLPPLSGRH